MEESVNKYNSVPEEEEGIDIMALVKSLWEGRKTIIICVGVFMVLGLVAALTMKRTYTVNTVMVPQMSSSRNSTLSSLASLAGFDLGSAPTADLSPLTYPQIVSSTPFRLELIHTPLHYAKADTAVSMMDYALNYNKPSIFTTVKKYTIGLPGVIIGAIRGKKPEIVLPGGSGESNAPKPLIVSEDEAAMIKAISNLVTLAVDKKEGLLTLSVTGSEPIQTAELAMKAQRLLQEEITRFRTEKAQKELEYVQARYEEIKEETSSYQNQLAVMRDRAQNMTSLRSQTEIERLQSKYTLSNSIFMEVAKQLEQSKMQVKKDTPAFTIVQPVAVPRQPSNSRAKTLIVWTFLGIVLGCGLVLLKGYLPKIKEMFASEEAK